MPKRNEENNSPKKVAEKNNKRLKGAYKKDKINSQQMERHYWRKRAKAVGIEPLPPGRPSKDKLNRWQKDIIEAETKFANGILPNKQKSP